MSSRAGLGVVLLAAGTLWLLTLTGVVDLSYGVVIGILLILVGVVIAVTPGRHALLVLVGLLIALAGIPALFVDSDLWTEGIGEAEEAPQRAADLEPFEHGIGKLTVDLTAPNLDLDGAVVVARLGIGDLQVLVPASADVTLDAHVGAGNVEAFGESENGFDVDLDGISGTSGTQEFELEAEVGLGNLRVEMEAERP
jgi:predicted membrane protein